MLMQQVREFMTVNQEMTDESSWIWLTSEQMGFPLRSEFANENHVQQQWSRTDKTADAVGSTFQTAGHDPLLLPEREVHA